MAQRLISFSYTYADDKGNINTINNVDGAQIHEVAASFKAPIVVSGSTYNKQQNPRTRNMSAA
jgi:hypothetical protein